ncbi:hypothetical protein F2Q69_00022899 [Brassica cretica]|uniref:Uncharacterized protein n=1 Tax=Brassica cretica TaxID=69181 RepID=A0A8S9QM13_BRACR|nr:hypothetical protein F2Q69_00022899 [Brassica cretica]
MGRRQHVWSNSANGQVGRLVRSNSPNGRVGRLRSMQLAHLANWMASVGPTHPFCELNGFGRSNSPIWPAGRLRSVQLAHLASWTACSIQLAHLASWTSWTACSVKSSCFVGWTLVFRCPGSVFATWNVAPKVEFSDHSIDPEECNAYWTARGEPKHPPPGIWRPAPFRANPVDGCPSSSCLNGLDAIRNFCRVPELVEFRLPVVEEFVESPPDGYFTCFEVHLMQCHL